LRIAIWHNQGNGGARRVLSEQVAALVERGHDIVSFAPGTADRSAFPFPAVVQEHRSAPDAAPSGSSPKASQRFRADLDRHAREVAGRIDAGGFDVAFVAACRFENIPPLARYLRTPSVFYMGEPTRKWFEAAPRLPWAEAVEPQDLLSPARLARSVKAELRGWWQRRILARESDSVREFSMVLANSLYTRECTLRAYGVDARLCLPGIDAQRFHPSPNREAGAYVVGLGAVAAHKGIDRALRILGRLSAPRPRLVWIGNYADDEVRRDLLDRAARCGVELDLRIGITDDEVVRLLGEARLMLYTPRLEPLGLAPLEAMACGCPVVAPAEGGVRETVVDGEGGRLALPEDAALAEAVDSLWRAPEEAADLGRRGRERVVSRWSWTQAGDRLEALLREASAGRT